MLLAVLFLPLAIALPFDYYGIFLGNLIAEKVLPTDERPATTQTTIVERVFEVTAPAKIGKWVVLCCY